MSNDARELAAFRVALRDGLHTALRYLNSRTPHRFTGVYRYDGEVLRNMALFDRSAPETQRGIDIPMADAYCANVGRWSSPMLRKTAASRTCLEVRWSATAAC
jgi:hypothetical protein